MPKAYSLDFRERVVRFVERWPFAARGGGAFWGVGVLRGEADEAYRATGSLAPRPAGGRRHAKLDPHRRFLWARCARRTTSPCRSWRPSLAPPPASKADPASLSRWLIRNGYRFKKNAAGQRARSPRRRKARAEWMAKRQPSMRLEPHRLVFIDETGTNTKMTRLRGRCRRASGCAPRPRSDTGRRRPSSPACAAMGSPRLSSSTRR